MDILSTWLANMVSGCHVVMKNCKKQLLLFFLFTIFLLSPPSSRLLASMDHTLATAADFFSGQLASTTHSDRMDMSTSPAPSAMHAALFVHDTHVVAGVMRREGGMWRRRPPLPPAPLLGRCKLQLRGGGRVEEGAGTGVLDGGKVEECASMGVLSGANGGGNLVHDYIRDLGIDGKLRISSNELKL